MGKAVTTILIGAAIIGAAFLTGGASLVPTITGGSAFGGIVVATTLATTTLGSIALTIGAGAILTGVMAATAGTPKVSQTQLGRLTVSLDPSAPRKMVFGRTALATDLRYTEPSGTNQEYIDYIICVASHRVTSIEEIWLEDALAWTPDGGVQGGYGGYLWVNTILEGGPTAYHTVNSGFGWGASERLTGCASVHLRVKRSGNGSAQSPLASGLPSRVTIIGRGCAVYDPRYDSTVGGSGPMRANDQSTWSYYAPDGVTELGENIALQDLTYLLGWKINGKIAVGRGLPPARLGLANYIESANLCDEAIVLSAGGTQPRYRGAGVIGEDEDPATVLQTFATSCNGRHREEMGQLSLIVMHNDLALASSDPGLTDDDFIGSFTWNPEPALEQTYNVVRGRYIDPSPSSLYQLVDYPEVRIDSPDGIDRILTMDLAWIEDPARAQRIAKQVLQRKQYQRSLSVTVGPRGWAYKVGDIVPVTLSALSMNRWLGRVDQQQITFDGTCPMVLIEEAPPIYAWDAEDSPAVVAAAPIRYDPLNNPVLVAIQSALDSVQDLAIEIANIVSDGILGKGEKPQVYRDLVALSQNHDALDAKAAALGIASSERSDANAKMTALVSYLGSLSPSWTDNNQDTPIDGPTFQSKWTDATDAIAALQAAIQGQPGSPGAQGDPGPQGDPGSPGPPGSNAPLLQIQYSVDGSSWHGTYTGGDRYLRMSSDNGVTWGSAYLLQGGEIAYAWVRSGTTPSAPPSSPGNYPGNPGGNPASNTRPPSGWYATDPGGTDPLWMTFAHFGGDGYNYTGWNAPIRVQGVDGGDGPAGPPGTSPIVQGSVDGSSSWHEPPTTGDQYLRISNDGGATFGSPFRVAGTAAPPTFVGQSVDTIGDNVYSGIITVANGKTIGFDATIYLYPSGGSPSGSMSVQYSLDGSSWSIMSGAYASGSYSIGHGDGTTGVGAAGTWTNSTGSDQAVRLKFVVVNSAGTPTVQGGGMMTPSLS